MPPHPSHVAHLANIHQIMLTIIINAATLSQQAIVKTPKNTSILTGKLYVQELLSGHEVAFLEVMRMRKHVFRLLCEEVRRVGLVNSKNMEVEEMLAIFLYIMGQNVTQRLAENRFQRSIATINA